MTGTVRKAAGSLLVVGLGGPELNGEERAWLKLVRPAGIILFRRNIDGPKQTRALLGESAALCASISLRCVDVEGGTVDRLRDALAPMPSAQAVARAMGLKRSEDLYDPTQGAKIRRGGPCADIPRGRRSVRAATRAGRSACSASAGSRSRRPPMPRRSARRPR